MSNEILKKFNAECVSRFHELIIYKESIFYLGGENRTKPLSVIIN